MANNITIICANDGLPMNGETTFATHLYRYAENLGHTPMLLIVGEKGIEKNPLPKNWNIIEAKEISDCNFELDDKTFVCSVPYKRSLDSARLLKKLEKIDYTFFMHGHTNEDSMHYKEFCEKAKKVYTNDKQLKGFCGAKFVRTPFSFGPADIVGQFGTKNCIVPVRLCKTKNIDAVKNFIAKESKVVFFVAKDQRGINNELLDDIIRRNNVLATQLNDYVYKEEHYYAKDFCLDLSSHTKYRGNLNYTFLEAMYYGVCPIYDGEFMTERIEGLDFRDGTESITEEMWCNITSKNRKILEKEYGNRHQIRRMLR